ncbi:DUF4112 domain-containing protein [Phenylobacterium sp.]|uniref:DUF4112 domain-containing protein n=1 Tax=Phenylobacterium sp. TaxID=1871053 RepID=UPI00286E6A17|nr:DUF4112 domain-containing protein [Phenylobacterium sp.]
MAVSRDRAHQSWRAAERVKGLSDRLIGIGPFGIGLDGVLAWVPGLGTAYSLAAGGALILSGITGGASLGTLLRMGAYLAADSMTSTVPVAGWAIDTLFPAHLMAAKALQKDIEKRHGPAEMPLGWGGKKKRARGGKLRNVTPQL